MPDHPYHEFLTAVAALVTAFLKENGGMGNGYETYAEGRILRNGGPYAKWLTPKAENLTGREVRDKGRDLMVAIQRQLTIFNVESVDLVAKHMEHGCFVTTVQWVNPEPPYVQVRL